MGTPSATPTANQIGPEAPARDRMSRRDLLIAGAAALGSTAISYARVVGSNDRVSLAQVGIGNRGRAAKSAASAYGRAPRSFQYIEELLKLKDVDAVIISTADFQHAPLLRL